MRAATGLPVSSLCVKDPVSLSPARVPMSGLQSRVPPRPKGTCWPLGKQLQAQHRGGDDHPDCFLDGPSRSFWKT